MRSERKLVPLLALVAGCAGETSSTVVVRVEGAATRVYALDLRVDSPSGTWMRTVTAPPGGWLRLPRSEPLELPDTATGPALVSVAVRDAEGRALAGGDAMVDLDTLRSGPVAVVLGQRTFHDVAPADVAPAELVAPPGLDFGSVRPGDDQRRWIPVQNRGGTLVGPLDAHLTGADADAFRLDAVGSCVARRLVPGEVCWIGVHLAPTAPGTFEAALVVFSPPAELVVVPLGGKAPAAVRLRAETKVDFGPVAVGKTAKRALVIENQGAAPAELLGVGLETGGDGDLALSGDPCSGTTLPPGARCELDLRFTPSAPKERAARLTVRAAGAAALVVEVRGAGE